MSQSESRATPQLGATHTPGPWFVFESRKTLQVGTAPAPGETRYAVVHWAGFDATDKPLKEQAANAHLIAAAPDLLAALEALTCWSVNGRQLCFRSANDIPMGMQKKLERIAKAALKKARGE